MHPADGRENQRNAVRENADSSLRWFTRALATRALPVHTRFTRALISAVATSRTRGAGSKYRSLIETSVTGCLRWGAFVMAIAVAQAGGAVPLVPDNPFIFRDNMDYHPTGDVAARALQLDPLLGFGC